MGKNIKVISLSGIPRKFSVVPAIKNIGYVKLNTDRYDGYHRHNIEFCIRLKSSVEFAEDTIGEKKLLTPFPHVFIKQPPALHKYNYNAKREAFFIIYPVELRQALLDRGIPRDKIVV